MDTRLVYDKALTPADFLVLTSLEKEAKQVLSGKELSPDVAKSGTKLTADDATSIARLKATRNPDHAEFTPTIFLSVDGIPAFIPSTVVEYLIKPYVCLARKIVRHETDVVMLTHLILYATTSVPSAIYLFRHFTYLHGFLHLILQGYYIGTYTLMMHQHIHQRGILTKGLALFDTIFPYLTDPLMGHTWNTYYYHHVKHHHVESNGPEDLSSTIRYQRDSIKDFLQYVGKFYFLVWLDLPLYFVRKNRPSMAVRAAGWEFGTYIFYYLMVTRVNAKAAMFVLVLPLMLVRFGLMAGNWGQHAFVDDVEPDSDFRSSITLIDVAVSSPKLRHRRTDTNKTCRAIGSALMTATTPRTISTP